MKNTGNMNMSCRVWLGVVILASLFAVSCEKEVDFPADKDGRIYVNAMIGMEGRDRIDVVVSQPAFGAEETGAEDVSLYLEADGKAVELVRDMESDMSGVVSYVPQDAFRPGQKLVLRAEADGLPSVKAETTMPASLPEVNVESKLVVSYREDEAGQSMGYLRTRRNFHVVLDEMPQDDSYFGIQVLKRRMFDVIGTVPDYLWDDYEALQGIVEYDELYVNANISEGGEISSIKSELIVENAGGDMKVSAAESDNGKSAIDVFVKAEERYLKEAHYQYVNGVRELISEIYELYEYNVKVFRLSPEIYHYFRARFIVEESDAPIHLGFTPATYTYTNVEGGLGMFGAVSMYETDWFRID